MPWRGPEVPGEFPTLGYLAADWIEAHCVIPDGDRMGAPFTLTDEQLRFLLWHYRIRPTARVVESKPSAPFSFRRSQLVRSQKWGKGPLAAGMICNEAEGPALFDGWDANGEPVGRPWPTPWIQVTAVSEDQTDNVWRSLLPMIELGALKDVMPDLGLTRINLPGGGFIEPVTASSRSRLGQRLTFAVQDQTESWLARNGGHQLADNQRRNLAGMGGRSIETPNAYDPSEQSVAQMTHEAGAADIHIDYPAPLEGSFANKRERRRCLRHAYGDSARTPRSKHWIAWIDLDRIDAECEELVARGEIGQAERWFGNRTASGVDHAFDAQHWATLANRHELDDGEVITIGVDGARYDDALSIIGTHVATGYQWNIYTVERPKNAGDEYEHPFDEADTAVIAVVDRLDMFRMYVDPQEIDSLVDTWLARWGKDKVVIWRTDRDRQVAHALRAYRNAMTSGDLSHDGDEMFARHIANARKRTSRAKDDEGRPMWTVAKEYRGSPNKIDATMAGTLSWEARGDAIAAGALTRKKYATAGW